MIILAGLAKTIPASIAAANIAAKRTNFPLKSQAANTNSDTANTFMSKPTCELAAKKCGKYPIHSFGFLSDDTPAYPNTNAKPSRRNTCERSGLRNFCVVSICTYCSAPNQTPPTVATFSIPCNSTFHKRYPPEQRPLAESQA